MGAYQAEGLKFQLEDSQQGGSFFLSQDRPGSSVSQSRLIFVTVRNLKKAILGGAHVCTSRAERTSSRRMTLADE